MQLSRLGFNYAPINISAYPSCIFGGSTLAHPDPNVKYSSKEPFFQVDVATMYSVSYNNLLCIRLLLCRWFSP